MSFQSSLPDIRLYDQVKAAIALCEPDDERLSLTQRKLAHFFKCMSCVFTCDDQAEFDRHLGTAGHCSRLPCFYCKQLGHRQPYEVDPSYIEHQVLAHGLRTLQCGDCSYRAVWPFQMDAHLLDVHIPTVKETNRGRLRELRLAVIRCKQQLHGPQLSAHRALTLARPIAHLDCKLWQCYYCDYAHHSQMGVFLHLLNKHTDQHPAYYEPTKRAESEAEGEPEPEPEPSTSDGLPGTPNGRLTSAEADEQARLFHSGPKRRVAAVKTLEEKRKLMEPVWKLGRK